MREATNGKCEPCRVAMTLAEEELNELRATVSSEWNLAESHTRLLRTFRFEDFRQALAFVVAVGTTADDLGHHPHIALSWGRVDIALWTHKGNRLTTADIELARRIDALTAVRRDAETRT